MIFNPEQIQEVLDIIFFNHLFFIGHEVGTDMMSKDDWSLLNRHGIQKSDFNTKEISDFEKAFYFGKLTRALNDQFVKDITYNDFKQYLRRGQYQPLTQAERFTLQLAKARTYNHIKNLGNKAQRDVYESIISNAVQEKVLTNKSVSKIILELGEKTADWKRDLGRIIETEVNNVFEEGRAAEIEAKYGSEAEVYKTPYTGACKWCIKFFLTDGIGSQPIIYKLSKLRSFGDNIGRKTADWQPSVKGIHPFCRCPIHYKRTKWIWDQEKQNFVPPPFEKERREKGIIIHVGDKQYQI